MSRHPLHRPEGHDISKLSQHQIQRKEVMTRSSCRDTSFTKDMSQPNKSLLRQGLRQRRSRQGLNVATVLTNWASNLKSTKKCIEIREQLQNPINTQLLLKKRSSWRLERKIWVAEGSCNLIFLFFYFLFFSFFRLVYIFI